MKNIKEIIVNNIVAITVIIVLLFSGYLAYYSIVIIPANKIKAQEEARKIEYLRISTLNSQYKICEISADINYSGNWSNECKLMKRKKDCSLPIYKAQILSKRLKDARKECLDIFKAQK